MFENLGTDPDPIVQSFAANAGWFQHFKEYCGYHNLKGPVEAAAPCLLTAGKPPVVLHVTV